MSRLVKILQRLGRARDELDEACKELETWSNEDRHVAPIESADIRNVRARVDALEARVAAIEGRGEF